MTRSIKRKSKRNASMIAKQRINRIFKKKQKTVHATKINVNVNLKSETASISSSPLICDMEPGECYCNSINKHNDSGWYICGSINCKYQCIEQRQFSMIHRIQK